MAHHFRVEMDASLQDSWLVHRILNFKEELYRELLRGGHASFADPSAVDRVLIPLSFTAKSKRSLGNISAIITSALKHHDVANAVVISRTS